VTATDAAKSPVFGIAGRLLWIVALDAMRRLWRGTAEPAST
jgi:hypothetical protein